MAEADARVATGCVAEVEEGAARHFCATRSVQHRGVAGVSVIKHVARTASPDTGRPRRGSKPARGHTPRPSDLGGQWALCCARTPSSSPTRFAV